MSMGFIAVGAAALGTATSIYATNKNARIAKDAADASEIERNKQQAALKKEMDAYRSMEYKNPFENMENVYEDLTVNQQQAEFQAQQGAQQRADIMQNLRGAAGGSGIAGLAQALANQGQLQTQQISASIGQQEARNQALRAQGASSIQSLERQGEQYVQQSEMDRQATLTAMAAGEATGANLAHQQNLANQMNAQIAQNQAIASGITNIGSAIVGGYQNEMFPFQQN
tara:strand:- start:177 stop:860 length:684 start_codon:yes stop_codon:yes gene_type:complete